MRCGREDRSLQAGLAFGGVPVDPGLHALAGDAHRRRDVGLGPAGLVTLDDQQPAVERQPSITVGHENLRVGVGLRQATPQPGVLLTSRRLAATNVLAGYT